MSDRGERVSGPRTLVGQWLRAVALEQFRIRDEHREAVKRSGGWTRGRIEVVHAAFVLIAQRWHALHDSPAELRSLLLTTIERYQNHEKLPLYRMEAMVRHALGEPLAVDTIEETDYLLISQALYTSMTDALSPAVAAVDLMLADAERAVVLGGLTPFTPAEAELTGITIDDLR